LTRNAATGRDVSRVCEEISEWLASPSRLCARGDTLVGINASTGSVVLNDIGVDLADGVASMTFDGSHIWAATGTGGLIEIDDPVS
jgi:hypothetical protein